MKVQRISHNLPPLNKKVVCFILAFLTFMAGITGDFFSPQTAYAYSHIGNGKYTFTADNGATNIVNSSVGGSVSSTNIIQRRLTYIDVDFPVTITGNKGDIVKFDFTMLSDYYADCGYLLSCGVVGLIGLQPGDYVISEDIDFQSQKTVVTEFELFRDCENEVVDFKLSLGYLNYDTNANLSNYANINYSLKCEVIDSNKSLLNSIIEYIKEIFNSLKELPNKIQSFFSDLKDNISAWFDDVGNWFVELGDKIKGFFSELSDNISGFFEKLWNKIWWGNENGESEYQPPTFSSGLTEILDKIDEYITSLEDTQTEIDNAKNNIVGYVEQGTSVINSVFGVFPTALTALVLFAIAFLFARKVVGR